MNALRQHLHSGRGLQFVGAPTALFARLIEAHGFDGVYLSGAGLAMGVYGIPDDGSLTLEQVAHATGMIAAATSLPVIVDADVGFSDEGDIGACIRALEDAGAAGIQVEDQVSAKKCGHLDGKQLIPAGLMCEKLRSAVAARRDPDLVLIARTDAKGVTGWDDALARAKAYREAGADMIFIEALATEGEWRTFAEQCPGPLLANMTEYGKSELLPRDTLASAGYTVVIYPVTLLRLMLQTADEALARLKHAGDQRALVPRMWSRKQLYDLIDYDHAVPDWAPPK